MTNRKDPHVHNVEPLINGRTITRSPWRERLANGELSPWYGPTDAEFCRRMKEYRDSPIGGGLWDFSQEPKRARARKKLEKARREAIAIMEWVHIHASEMPERELEAAYHVWRDGRTPKSAAKKMGVDWCTLRTWLKRTRDRMKRGLYE